MKIQQPKTRQMVTGEVVSTKRLSPTFVRLTIRGDDLTALDDMGFDYSVRLFFLREGQTSLEMPTISNNVWIAQFLLKPKSRRPWVRNYTIRSIRPDLGEVDIDFALHGDAGPASAWAAAVQPGEPVGLFPEGIYYLPPAPDRRVLLVGEESAVPAILSILERLDPATVGDAYLEVPRADDIIADADHPAGVTVHWLPRGESAALPGALALETVSAAELSEDPLYVWIAGEQALPTGLRRDLVTRGVAKSDITFIGYWKHGRASVG